MGPEDVVADVVHFVSARVWHIREDAELWEQSRLQISVDLVIHGASLAVGLDSIEDLREPFAIIVFNMNDKVLHLWHDVQVELGVDFWPCQRLSVESVQLGASAVNCSVQVSGLNVDLLFVVVFGEEASAAVLLVEELTDSFTTGIVRLGTSLGEVERECELLFWVERQVIHITRLTLTVSGDLDGQQKLLFAGISLVKFRSLVQRGQKCHVC